jgi:class 3 adenylate cyclase
MAGTRGPFGRPRDLWPTRRGSSSGSATSAGSSCWAPTTRSSGPSWTSTAAATSRSACRIGIHTGEAIHHDGDFYGRSVVCAARIAGQAEGGEVLISSLVKELVEGRGDVPLREAGEFELKGLAGRQRLFRVAWSPPGVETRTFVQSQAVPGER